MLLSLDEHDNRPLYLQIVNQIKEQVSNGTLQPGNELPSVREVADSLGINMHTVRSAYLKLRDQDIITLRLGRRAKVARRQSTTYTTDMEADLKARVRELITDALLIGLSADDFLDLVSRQLEQQKDK